MEQQTETRPTIALSKVEVARELRVCLRTIDHLIATRQLTCRKIGRRVIVPRSSLVAFLQKAN